MKIALTLWGNRISPVFDSAQKLLIAEMGDGQVISKTYESFNPESIHLLDRLKELEISVLICGAISEMSANLIAPSNIRLIPFITGNAIHILEHYMSNKPVPHDYFMPGYYRKGYRGGLKNAPLNIKKGVRQMVEKETTTPERRGRGKDQGTCRSGNGPGKKQGCGPQKCKGQNRSTRKGSGNQQGSFKE